MQQPDRKAALNNCNLMFTEPRLEHQPAGECSAAASLEHKPIILMHMGAAASPSKANIPYTYSCNSCDLMVLLDGI
jgi:hypothetical protein